MLTSSKNNLACRRNCSSNRRRTLPDCGAVSCNVLVVKSCRKSWSSADADPKDTLSLASPCAHMRETVCRTLRRRRRLRPKSTVQLLGPATPLEFEHLPLSDMQRHLILWCVAGQAGADLESGPDESVIRRFLWLVEHVARARVIADRHRARTLQRPTPLHSTMHPEESQCHFRTASYSSVESKFLIPIGLKPLGQVDLEVYPEPRFLSIKFPAATSACWTHAALMVILWPLLIALHPVLEQSI